MLGAGRAPIGTRPHGVLVCGTDVFAVVIAITILFLFYFFIIIVFVVVAIVVFVVFVIVSDKKLL